jgi:hypothetical protein
MNKHWELTSSPTSVESYSQDLTTCLSALYEVAKHLSRSTEPIIVSLSIQVTQIHAPTQLAILYLPAVPLDLML